MRQTKGMAIVLTIALALMAIAPPRLVAQSNNPAGRTGESQQRRRLVQSPLSGAIPILVYLLDRYAKDSSEKTEIDRGFEQAIEKASGSREVARRLVDNFLTIPLPERRAVFGRYAEPTQQNLSDELIRSTFKRL
jgi:hypothetical protein